MKKICNLIIIFVLAIMISKSVFATEYWDKENKKREKVYKEALNSYMQTFTKEDTPEEDRITKFEFTGYSQRDKEENNEKLYSTISFHVEPYNEKNTTWSKTGNYCFAQFSKINNEYVLDKISRYPENYDEFLKRFEQYKKTSKESNNTEKTIIQREAQGQLADQEIQKINIGLIILFVILFIISGIILITYIKKK